MHRVTEQQARAYMNHGYAPEEITKTSKGASRKIIVLTKTYDGWGKTRLGLSAFIKSITIIPLLFKGTREGTFDQWRATRTGKISVLPPKTMKAELKNIMRGTEEFSEEEGVEVSSEELEQFYYPHISNQSNRFSQKELDQYANIFLDYFNNRRYQKRQFKRWGPSFQNGEGVRRIADQEFVDHKSGKTGAVLAYMVLRGDIAGFRAGGVGGQFFEVYLDESIYLDNPRGIITREELINDPTKKIFFPMHTSSI